LFDPILNLGKSEELVELLGGFGLDDSDNAAAGDVDVP
jgi:hypothetical protein